MNENYAGTSSSRQKRARLSGTNWLLIARCGLVSTFGITDLPIRPKVLGTAQNQSLSQFGADRFVLTEYVCDPAECKQSEVPAATAKPHDTVPNLFTFIDGLLNHSMSSPRVHYDKQYGFPASIVNDRYAISDDEFSVTVWDFQVLE